MLAVVVVGITIYLITNSSSTPKFKNAPKDSEYLYTAGNQLYSVSIGIKDANKPFVQFKTNEETQIKFSLLDTVENVPKPSKKGNKVIFEDVMNGMDLIYQTLDNGLKEELVLKQAPQTNQFLFTMELEAADAQQIITNFPNPVFYDKQGNYLFHFEEPFAVDASGNRTDEVTMQIKKSPSGGQYQVRLSVDEQWLYSSERAYPIVIDPTIIHDTSGEFARGQFNGIVDTGSPQLESYYQELPADEHTIGLWHMNEGSLDTCSGNVNDICDSSTNGFDGAFTFTANFDGSGRVGDDSLVLDGDSDYVDTEEGSTYSIDVFTVSAWIYRDSDSGASEFIVDNQDSSTVGWVTYINSTDQLHCFYNSSSAIGTTKINTGRWYHTTCTSDGSTLSVYVDGVFEKSVSITGSISETTNARIGARSYTTPVFYFPGKIDEVRISDIARTPEEIKAAASKKPYAVYTSPVLDLGSSVNSWLDFLWSENGVTTGDGETVFDSTNLVAQWNLNETSGTTANNDAEGTSCGGTPANCDGTLNGFDDTTGQDADPDSSWTANNRRWGAGALLFDGTDNYISVTDNAALDITDNVTLEAWVKFSDLPGYQALMGKRDASATEVNYAFRTGNAGNSDELEFYFSASAAFQVFTTNNANLKPGRWYHVVSTYDGSTVKIYKDGILLTGSCTTGSCNASMEADNNTFGIGRAGDLTTELFQGVMDAPKIYNRILDNNEVLSLYNSSNIQFQTRIGNDSSPDDGSWDAWSPTTNSTSIENFDDPYAYDTSDANLVGYWPMDETEDDTCGAGDICDAVDTNHGVDSGGSLIVDGKFGNARGFDGSNDYNTISYDSTLDGMSTLTVEAWVNPRDCDEDDEIVKKSNSYILRLTSTCQIETYTWADTDINELDSTTTLPIGSWSHVVLVYDGSDQIIYINGNQEATTDPQTGSIDVDAGQDVTIGATAGGASEQFKGVIDEVRIYKDALTAAEVHDKWLAGATNPNTVHSSTSYNSSTYSYTTPSFDAVISNYTDAGATNTLSSFTVANNSNRVLVASIATRNNAAVTSITWNGGAETFRKICSNAPGSDVRSALWYLVNPTATTDDIVVTMDQSTNISAGIASWYNVDQANSIGNCVSSDGVSANPTVTLDSNLGEIVVDVVADQSASSTLSASSGQAQLWTEEGANSDGGGSYKSGAPSVTMSWDETTSDTWSISAVPIRPVSTSEKVEIGKPQLDESVAGLWHLDETNGNNGGDDIFDETANNNDGEISGSNLATAVVNGISGKARDFDGSADFITVSHDSVLTPTGDYTLEAWIKTSTTDDHDVILGKFDHSSFDGYIFSVGEAPGSQGKVCLWEGDQWVCGTIDVDDGVWHYTVGVLNGNDVIIYVDGVEDTMTTTTPSRSNTNSLTIGDRSDAASDGKFLGTIDEVRISNVARTAEEIAESYRMGRDHYINRALTSSDLSDDNQVGFYVAADRPGTYLEATVGESAYVNYQPDTNIVGFWHLDEATDDACNGGNSDSCDASGNANHGDATSASIVPGIRGKARDFNGTSSTVNLPDVLNGQSNATLEAWIKPNDWTDQDNIVMEGGGTNAYFLGSESGDNFLEMRIISSSSTFTTQYSLSNVPAGSWYHVVGVYSGSNYVRLFVNGILVSENTTSIPASVGNAGNEAAIGSSHDGTSNFFDGVIDEVSMHDTARTPDEIRQAYEIGRRTHPITIDFTADLNSTDLIDDATDLAFDVDATAYGLEERGSKLFEGDKIIVREKVDATEYIAQGNVTSVVTSGGEVLISAWDPGSTFPTSGFTANATVFKWQREYFDLSDITLDAHQNAIDELTLRVTNGSEGRTVWIDDLTSEGDFMTTDTGSTISSNTGSKYFQYRAIMSSGDEAVSANLTELTLDYTTDAPDLYWKFDENYGSTAYDHSQSVLNGSITGATWTESSRCANGTCLQFDGTDDYVIRPETPQVDSVDSIQSDSGSVRTLSSFTVADNPNRLLVCGTSVRGAVTVTGITWDGASQSFIKINDIQPGSDLRVELWYLLDPNVATDDIVGTFSSAQNIMLGCISIYNVDQTTPLGTDNENNDTGDNTTLDVESSIGDLVVDILGDQSGNGVVAADSSQDEHWTQENVNHDGGMSTKIATSTTTTMTWSQGVSDVWASIGVAVKPALTSASALDYEATDDFTIQGWFRHKEFSTAGEVIIAKYEATGSDGGYKIDIANDGDIAFKISDDNSLPKDAAASTNAGYDDNNWHHFAAVKNGTTSILLYVDAIQVGSDTSLATTGSLANDDPFYVGIDGDGSGNAYEGFLDDIKVYRYARSAADIKTDFVNGSAIRGASSSFGPDDKFLSDGLVGYWKMDETAENLCTGGSNDSCDSSGNGFDLEWTNEATTTTGKYGAGTTYDGTNDYASCTDANCGGTGNLDFAANSTFSYGAWIKTTTTGVHDAILVKKETTGSTGAGYNLYHSNSDLPTCNISDDTTQESATGTSAINDDAWHHVFCVNDGTNFLIYVDGVLEDSVQNQVAGSYDNTFDFNIAQFGNGSNDFPGQVDEARIYNRALSPAQVQALYNWAPGPIGYWPMDENTGTATTFDKSGNGNDGTLNGTMTEADWVAGKYGSALDFDSSDDFVEVTDNNVLDLTTAGTLQVWVKKNSLKNYQMYITKGHTTAYQLMDSGTTGKIVIRWGTDSDNLTSNNVVPVDVWNHIAATYDGGTLRIYINGVLDNEIAHTTDAVNNATALRIGARDDGFQFDGALDEARIYNYARTPGQIIEDMNGGHPLGGSPIGSEAAYWSFDEQNGQTVFDRAVSRNDGTRGANSTASTDDPTWKTSTDCKINGCLSFDGTADFVNVTDDNALDISSKKTFTGWFNVNESALNRDIISKGLEYLIRFNTDDTFSFFLYDGTDYEPRLTAPTNPATGTWTHFAAVYDSTLSSNHQKLYLDGVLVAQQDRSITTTPTSNDLKIGSFSTTRMDGSLDEIKIYSAALTPAQILIDMNAGSAASFGSVLGNSEASDLTDGAGNPPLGYWPMDENTGTSTTADKSGNDNDGTLNSITELSWVPGKFGSALSLDGSADYIDLGSAALINQATAWSVSAWIKNTLATDGTIYSEQSTAATDVSLVMGVNTSGAIAFQVHDGESWQLNTGDATVNDGKWHHVLGTFSTTNGTSLYVDGILDKAVSGNTNVQQAAQIPTIGAYYTAPATRVIFYDGEIDELKIWDYELSPAQASYDYNRGRPIGWWKLDECGNTTAYDSSRNGNGDSNANHGTITIGSSGTNTSAGTCSSGAGDEAWDNGTTGKLNSSLDFDGTDDYVDLNDNDGIDSATELTACAWVKHSSTNTDDYIIEKYDGSDGWGMIRDDIGSGSGRTDTYKIFVADSTDTDSANIEGATGASPSSTWTHVCMTFIADNGSGLRLYVNGQEDANSPTTTSGITAIDAGSQELNLGVSYVPSSYFDGQIDDVRVYNYALSPAQIRKVMLGQATVRFGPSTGSP